MKSKTILSLLFLTILISTNIGFCDTNQPVIYTKAKKVNPVFVRQQMEEFERNHPNYMYGGVMCTEDLRLCAVGDKTMSSNGAPLLVTPSAVCFSDGRVCTNGPWVLKTNKTIYR